MSYPARAEGLLNMIMRCCQDLLKKHSILVQFPSSFFSRCFMWCNRTVVLIRRQLYFIRVIIFSYCWQPVDSSPCLSYSSGNELYFCPILLALCQTRLSLVNCNLGFVQLQTRMRFKNRDKEDSVVPVREKNFWSL